MGVVLSGAARNRKVRLHTSWQVERGRHFVDEVLCVWASVCVCVWIFHDCASDKSEQVLGHFSYMKGGISNFRAL